MNAKKPLLEHLSNSCFISYNFCKRNGTTTPSAGTYNYQEGTIVDLYASPNSGNEFVKWIINGVEYLTQSVQVTMNANTTATAYFQVTVIPQYTLSMSVVGNGTTFYASCWKPSVQPKYSCYSHCNS
jgi:Flp pilus assembly protein TadG